MKFNTFLLLTATTTAYRLHDDVVLQVWGSPVHVNPESMLATNTEAATNLDMSIECGPDELTFVQGTSSKKAQELNLQEGLDMKASIKKFNKRLAQVNRKLQSHNLLGLMTAPVQFTESETLPDHPYTLKDGNKVKNGGDAVEGMVGTEDLGEKIRIGKHNVNYQRK